MRAGGSGRVATIGWAGAFVALVVGACASAPVTQDAPPTSGVTEVSEVPPRAKAGNAASPPDVPAPSEVPAPPIGPDGDPANEFLVAPPEAVPDCAERLTTLGVEFQKSELPLTHPRDGTFTCGAHDAVVYKKGPSGARLSPPAVMSCRMALAFAEVEKLIQELALQHLGSEVQRVHHVGTYNCRKMVRFDYVSEHSYGNAIDLSSFTLKDGRSISVFKHFGKLDVEPQSASSRFLRQLSSLAFDRNLVSVSLGPYWDPAHRDHFHLDMARYRVDGSRR